MYFKQFYDRKLAQYAYLIGCQATGEAVIIDPMRVTDFYLKVASEENLTIVAAVDTHIHADYLSGLREFAKSGIRVYASAEGGDDWQYEWLHESSYNYQFLTDGDTFKIGNITIRAWHTPGHTPEHLSYEITDGAVSEDPMSLITGDFVFVGDVGRPDLLESVAGRKGDMESSARRLYHSVKSLHSKPEYLQIWPGHGSGSACGKALGAIPNSTVGYELRYNKSIKAATDEDSFVEFILDGQPEPPLYFARMKRQNRSEPPLIGDKPRPVEVSAGDLSTIVTDNKITILDTRSSDAFVEGHASGSILSPFNRQFNTVAASYIDPEASICLIIDKTDLNEAVNDLLNTGLDNIDRFITPKVFREWLDSAKEKETVKTTRFKEIERCRLEESCLVVDVRSASEFEKSHIPGAVNLVWSRLPQLSRELPENKPLIVHCQTGKRSALATAWLMKNGYEVTLVNEDYDRYNPELMEARLS